MSAGAVDLYYCIQIEIFKAVYGDESCLYRGLIIFEIRASINVLRSSAFNGPIFCIPFLWY